MMQIYSFDIKVKDSFSRNEYELKSLNQRPHMKSLCFGVHKKKRNKILLRNM